MTDTTMDLRILVVEDEAIIGMLLERELARLSHKVWRTVSTGEEAVQLSVEGRPDLVLMDIKLAGAIDGLEAARRIACEYKASIIFMSAFGNQSVQDALIELQPLAYFEKPLVADHLRPILETLQATKNAANN